MKEICTLTSNLFKIKLVLAKRVSWFFWLKIIFGKQFIQFLFLGLIFSQLMPFRFRLLLFSLLAPCLVRFQRFHTNISCSQESRRTTNKATKRKRRRKSRKNQVAWFVASRMILFFGFIAVCVQFVTSLYFSFLSFSHSLPLSASCPLCLSHSHIYICMCMCECNMLALMWTRPKSLCVVLDWFVCCFSKINCMESVVC